MKRGTKLLVGILAMLGLMLLLFLVISERHTCPTRKHPLPSPVSVAHANGSLKHYDVQCTPFGDPPVSPKELAGSSFYTVTFTQDFKIINRTKNYMKFTTACEILRGPSRESEKRGVTEQIVEPNSIVTWAKVQIKWPRAFKTNQLKKFHYACDCTAKVVERPLKVLKMPFVPDER